MELFPLIKISLIIKDKKECPEEILIKLTMKISKSSWNTACII
jgi:hypothetical protein